MSMAHPVSPQRKIIHMDMDSFYASVELRDRPHLRGQPVAVGGSPEGRGVIAASSYEARKYGVRSAMSTAVALRLCPHLVLIRPDFSKYKKESLVIREICLRYTSLFEPLSLDEAYLDVSGSPHCGGSASLIAEKIRKLIFETTGLTASAGVAPNKFLAKIASDINKPNGIKIIRPHEIESFMKTLPIEKIWGVGKVTAAKMRALGIGTCGDLQKWSVADLIANFGSWGSELFHFARGMDDRPVKPNRIRKSLSVEETYAENLTNLKSLLSKLPELYDDWNERMVRADVATRIRSCFIKLKFDDFQNSTHESAKRRYPSIDDFRELITEAYERRSDPVRLIGIGVRLESASDKKRETNSSPQMSLELLSKK